MDGRARQTAAFGGKDAGSGSTGVPGTGDHSTGAGLAPAAGTLSGSPNGRGLSSSEVIRTILAGISRPDAPAGTVWGASGSTELVEGVVLLTAIEDALPEVVARAEHTRVPFTVLVARPGPAAAPGTRGPAPTTADVEDLTAALSVSLSPTQELYDAGRGHLAVVVPGRTGAGQREAMRLTRRAAAQGAPLFTWAAARFPRDASTAAGLLEVAVNRLDGRLVSRIDAAAARTPERGTGRYGAAIWAGVAAAVLLGAVAFALHGSGPSSPQTATGTMSSGLPGAGSGGGSAGGSSSGTSGSAGSSSSTGSGATGSSGAPGAGNATPAASGPSASTGASANSGPGSPSATTGTPQAGTSSTQNLLSTATTLPSTGGLLGGTSSTGTTGTTSGSTSEATGSGTGGTGTSGSTTTTTTTTAPSSTSSQCTGLVTSLTCTTNNLLGGLGL